MSKNQYNSELRRIRKSIGMTRKEMAELVGCFEVTIKRIEYGTLYPSLELVDRISAKTGCEIEFRDGHWDVKFEPVRESLIIKNFFNFGRQQWIQTPTILRLTSLLSTY